MDFGNGAENEHLQKRFIKMIHPVKSNNITHYQLFDSCDRGFKCVIAHNLLQKFHGDDPRLRDRLHQVIGTIVSAVNQ